MASGASAAGQGAAADLQPGWLRCYRAPAGDAGDPGEPGGRRLPNAVCAAAADLLDGQVASLEESWREDQAATRDLVEQIMALDESSARCPAGSDLGTRIIGLRAWASVS
jgi:hypothetical protein